MPNTFEKSIAKKKGLAGNSPHKTLDLVSHNKRTKVDNNALENGEYQANELTRDFRLNKKTKSKIKMNDRSPFLTIAPSGTALTIFSPCTILPSTYIPGRSSLSLL